LLFVGCLGLFETTDKDNDQQSTTNNQPALKMEVAVNWYLALSAVLFAIGTLGVLFRRNAIVVLMSVELMLNAVNLTLVTFSQSMGDPSGQMLVFFSIAVAAAEAAVGLAIVIAIFRSKVTVDITEINLFKH
jgi:NADH-quinone oxidoreductase subunit K